MHENTPLKCWSEEEEVCNFVNFHIVSMLTVSLETRVPITLTMTWVHMGNKDIITKILVKIPNIDTNDTLDRADKVDKYCQYVIYNKIK